VAGGEMVNIKLVIRGRDHMYVCRCCLHT